MLKDFLGKLAKYLPSKVLPAISGFITLPIITHLFAPAIYGKYVIAFSLCEFLIAGTVSGLAASVLRFYVDYRSRSALARFLTAINANLVLTVGITFSLVFVGFYLFRRDLDPLVYRLLRIALFVYVLRATSNVYLEVQRAREAAGVYTTFSLLFRYGSLGIGLALVLGIGVGVEGLLWGEVGSNVILLPILIYVCVRSVRFGRRDFSISDSRSIFRWAWPLLVGNLAMWGLNLSDRYVVAFFRPASEVGFYSLAYGISEKSMAILVSVFIMTVIPSVINTWETSGRSKAEEMLTLVTRVYLIAALPAAVGLAVLGLPIIKILATPSYYEGARAVGYVAFSMFFWGLAMFGTLGMIVSKRTFRIGANQVIAAGVNLLLNLLLVPRFGFVAAAITTLIGFGLLFGLQTYCSRSDLTWRFPLQTVVRVATSSCAMLVFLLTLSKFWHNSPVGVLAVGIVGGALIHFGVLGLLGEYRTLHAVAPKGI